jgi:serine phosphatase RsbU (regulator of sigma subunit)
VFTTERWPQQLLALGALSAILTLGGGGAAVLALTETVRTGHQLVLLSAAQRWHQDADMMHDALRTNVEQAEGFNNGTTSGGKEGVRDETLKNASEMRFDLAQLRAIKLPPRVREQVASLDVPRQVYAARAVRHVNAELGGVANPQARQDFEAQFQDLVKLQRDVTVTLANAATGVEEAQAKRERTIIAVVVLASAVLLAGWAFLVAMLRRAGMRLFQALGREAEQRTVAEQLRRTLLPERLPTIPGLRLAARSTPVNSATRVGGDWYDVICLPSGDVGLVVGDVVGHDLEAATAMGQLRAALRACAVDEPSPAAVLTRVNRVADLLQVTELTTCLYAVVTPSTRTVRWSSAGHLNPLAVHAIGSGNLLEGDPGPPIGVADDAVYCDRTCQLEPNGSLMLYTDGLVERRSSPISENLDRLELIRGAPSDPEQLCDYVMALMRAEESDVRDDVTVLVLHAL